MKKLFFVAVLSFGSLTAFAQEAETAVSVAEEVAVVQEDFTEIETNNVPEAVTEALATNYPSATINKAYSNDKDQYKLEVALEDGTEGTLYADKDGNWIEI